ncbi:hypothetical protein [Butyrivibrio proteoclasticus]|nr:hypothetical protein [Butyrivibrio proteoclasticus]
MIWEMSQCPMLYMGRSSCTVLGVLDVSKQKVKGTMLSIMKD